MVGEALIRYSRAETAAKKSSLFHRWSWSRCLRAATTTPPPTHLRTKSWPTLFSLNYRVTSLVCQSEQALQVQTPSEHRQLTLGRARPLPVGTIPIQLDAVAIRVAQVERFADAVVGSAVQLDA